MSQSEKYVRFICVSNKPIIYDDGSSDDADKLLTIGKSYYGYYSKDFKYIFLESTDKGSFPTGHRWVKGSNLKLFSDFRDDILDKILS